MKIAAVLDSISRANGGIFEAERRLLQHLASDPGMEIEVFGLKDQFSASDQALWKPLRSHALDVLGPQGLGLSWQMPRWLEDFDADLSYRAGLWKHPSRDVLNWGRRRRKPHIVAPHGMLDGWALKRSAWKKKLASLWYE